MTKNHNRPPGAIAAVLLLAGNLPAAENANSLATLRKQHPRLLFTAEDQKRVGELAEDEPLLARLIQQNYVNATAIQRGKRGLIRVVSAVSLSRQISLTWHDFYLFHSSTLKRAS